MARINTYATDNNITAQDKWIGTDSNGDVTKNFTPEGVANWINSTNSVGIAGQSNFKFQTDLGTGRQNGTISFDAGSGDGTLFSTVNDIKISKYGADGNLILDFLQNLVGTFILLCQVDDTNNFGVYRLDSLTQDEVETDFYTAVLTVYGSNGTLQTDEYYGVVAYPGSSIVSVTGLEAIDEGNGPGWRLIGRDPDNYGNIGLGAIDFSNSNSISTEKGSVGDGAITFGTNNINQSGQSIVTGSGVSLKKTNEFSASNIVTGESPLNIWGVTYNSLIAAWRSEVNVEGTSYDTNVVYQSLIVGDGLNFYAGRDSGVVGGGLISGSTGCFTVGVGNEDLTTTTSNYITNYYNNYGPRFIVGVGTYQPLSGAITRQNGFVVMSDGTATFPVLTNAMIDSAGDDSAVTKGWVNTNTGNTSGSGTTNYVSKWQDPNTLTDSVIYDDGTNVGIGIAPTTSKLSIGGDGITKINGSGVTIDRLLCYLNATGTLYVSSGEDSDIRFRTQPIGSTLQQRVIITSAGNMGIGTTSPSEKLTVSGNIKATKLLLNTTNTGYTLYSNGESRINGVTFQQISGADYLQKASGTGAFYVRNSVSGQNIYVGAADSSGQFANYLRVDGANNDAAIRTNNVDRLFINSSGNVGIGTTSPATKLDVASETGAVLRLGTSDTVVLDGDTIGRIEFFSSDATNTSSGLGAFIDLVADGDQNNFAPLGDLRFATSYASAQNATTRMTIKGNGNVGIGTTAPSEKLDVDGNIKLGATTGRQLMFGENKYGAIRLGNNTVIGGNQAVDIRTGNASVSSQSSRVFINQTGFVGVGTTTPIATLDVNGPIKMGNATTTPQASTVGTMRYRADSNNSYVEMIMQTGDGTYAWVIIQQNTW